MSQISNAIIGFTLADAFGVPVEFLERDTYEINELVGYGSWNVPAGSWSDDSAMMFITMQHLLNNDNIDQLKQSFCDWAYRGYWTFDDSPAFDVGITVREVIDRWELNGFHELAKTDEFSNGNGALMRILPVAIWSYAKKMTGHTLFSFVKTYAELTHGHIRSTLCCYHYTTIVHQLLDKHSLSESFHYANAALMEMLNEYPSEKSHFERLLILAKLPRDQIASTGYVIDTMEAVYWSLLNSSDYYEAIHLAVHLGKDTDTIGALTGGLAGLLYDELNVPDDWINTLAKIDEIQQLIAKFEEVALSLK